MLKSYKHKNKLYLQASSTGVQALGATQAQRLKVPGAISNWHLKDPILVDFEQNKNGPGLYKEM